MGRIRVAVLDAGPLIHLDQAGGRRAFDVLRSGRVTAEVVRELGPKFRLPRPCAVAPMRSASRDFATLLCERYSLGLGEATSIAVARQERIPLFFTDDLDAREIAERFGLEAHGSLALVARAFREAVLDRRAALEVIESLAERSSLYLTSDLVDWARRQISTFSG